METDELYKVYEISRKYKLDFEDATDFMPGWISTEFLNSLIGGKLTIYSPKLKELIKDADFDSCEPNGLIEGRSVLLPRK